MYFTNVDGHYSLVSIVEAHGWEPSKGGFVWTGALQGKGPAVS